MKIIKSVAAALAVLTLALVGLYFGMAERVEVVVLHSHGADGDHETRLWVLDDAGHAWLRTGANTPLVRQSMSASGALDFGGNDMTARGPVSVSPQIWMSRTPCRVCMRSPGRNFWTMDSTLPTISFTVDSM